MKNGLPLLGTLHGSTMFKVVVNSEGFWIFLADSHTSKKIDWLVPAFPLDLYEALKGIMNGHDHQSFVCYNSLISGEMQVVKSEKQPFEKFVLFMLTDGTTAIDIKLRDTEIARLFEVLEAYWTC